MLSEALKHELPSVYAPQLGVNFTKTLISMDSESLGDPYQVGVSSSHCHTTSTQQVNGQLHVGNTMTILAHNFVQDSSQVYAGKIEGEVYDYKMNSAANETHSTSSSYGVSSGGDFCVSQQQSDSRLVNHGSELHVHDSINGPPNEFVAHHLDSTGGKYN